MGSNYGHDFQDEALHKAAHASNLSTQHHMYGLREFSTRKTSRKLTLTFNRNPTKFFHATTKLVEFVDLVYQHEFMELIRHAKIKSGKTNSILLI